MSIFTDTPMEIFGYSTTTSGHRDLGFSFSLFIFFVPVSPVIAVEPTHTALRYVFIDRMLIIFFFFVILWHPRTTRDEFARVCSPETGLRAVVADLTLGVQPTCARNINERFSNYCTCDNRLRNINNILTAE